MSYRAALFLSALLISLALGFCVAHGQPKSPPIRIDTYDPKSNRTGYATVDPQTGRIDFYDTKSNRVGSGHVTVPPPPPTPTPTAPPKGPRP
jgi:hypothetical protein